MQNREFTVKGETFTSAHTHLSAMAALKAAVQNKKTKSSFARSLVAQCEQNGRLSEKQWPWVHKLAMDLDNPAPQRQLEDTNYHGIVELLNRAQGNLKRPKITVKIDGLEFRVSLAGDRASVPGSVNVTDLGGFNENTWYGRIHKDGRLEASRHMTQEIPDRLEALNSNPVGFASGYGRMTGACCFCASKLSTPESVTEGYGPKCAENWGLPWGNKRREVAA